MSYSEQLKNVLQSAGGPSALAAALGLTPSAVTQWTDVPARHLLKVHALTGIPLSNIRPDLAAAPKTDEAA